MFYTVGSDADGNLVILTDAAETCGGFTKLTFAPAEAEGLVRQAAFLLQTQKLPAAVPLLPAVPVFTPDTTPAPAPVASIPAPRLAALEAIEDEAVFANATEEALAADAAALRAKQAAGGAEPNAAWQEAQRKAELERDLRRAKLGGRNE